MTDLPPPHLVGAFSGLAPQAGAEVGWRLQATMDHELAGDVRDLEFVAQVPAGAALVGRFHIAAEIAIHTTADRWLTASFGPRRQGPALEVTYPLAAP